MSDGDRPHGIQIPKPRQPLEYTGERYTTAAEGEIGHEHLHRYLFALQFCLGKDVLDVASGEGYGSALLAVAARSVVGIDIDPLAVGHAQSNYGGGTTSFIVGDCAAIPLGDASMDVAVSFETIEHVQDQIGFLAEIRRVLRPGGLLVMSTPDTVAYREVAKDGNPHHVKELTREEFHGLLAGHFRFVEPLRQSSLVGSAIEPCPSTPDKASVLSETFRAKQPGVFSIEPALGEAPYLIAVASDRELPAVRHGLLDDRFFLLNLYDRLQERAVSVLRLEHEARIAQHALKEHEHEARIAQHALKEHEREARILGLALKEHENDAAIIARWLQDRRKAAGSLDSLQSDGKVGDAPPPAGETSYPDDAGIVAELKPLRGLAEAVEAALRTAAETAGNLEAELLRLRQQLAARDDHIDALEQRLEATVRSLEASRLEEAAARAALSRSQLATAGAASRPAGRLVGMAIRAGRRWASSRLLRAARRHVARFVLKRHPRVRALERTGLFYADYYLATNRDVAASGQLPAWHFLRHGAREGRKPNPLFDPAYYLEVYPDVAQAGANPVLHYARHGAQEGRNPGPDFDTRTYLAAHPDLAAAGMNPLAYHLRTLAEAGQLWSAPVVVAERPLLDGHAIAAANGRPAELAAIRRRGLGRALLDLEYRPLVSILMPTYNTDVPYLETAVRSVVEQVYPHWELRIVDDGSTAPQTLDALHRIAGWDSRIHVRRNASNAGISAATNDALRDAKGEFVAMLDHDDMITIDALLEMVRELNEDRDLDAIYSDQDHVSSDGAFESQLFKPDWSPQFFRGVMYVGHLLMVRRSLALEVGGFDSAFDFVQDFEFMLRVSERTRRIKHVPRTLYHWRRAPTSVAGGGKADIAVERLQAAAVQAHLARLKLEGRVVPSSQHPHRVAIEPAEAPSNGRICVVVIGGEPTTAAVDRLRRNLGRSGGKGMEVLLPSGWQAHAAAIESLGMAAREVAGMAARTEAVQLSQALAAATGEFVLILSEHLEIEAERWVDRLLLVAQEPDVACAGPVVLTPDGVVAHAGLVVGADRGICAAMAGATPEADGYAGSLSCAREVSALAGDAMLVRRSALASFLDERPAYVTADYALADFSLRCTKQGMRAICVPQVVARRSEVARSGGVSEFDRLLFKDIWLTDMPSTDQYYNPNFDSTRADYGT